jgi:ABC-type transport system substrate-binding protein
MTTGRRLSGLVALGLVLAGCASSAALTPTPPAAPTPTPVPGGSDGGSGSGGSGGNSGGGIVPPGGGAFIDPLLGQAAVFVPQPGQQDVHPVSVQLIRAGVDGSRVSVELRWWSGIAPCSVLDSVDVSQDGSTYTLTVNEGSSGQQVACVDLAQLKATVVNLGDLAPGVYTIAATGDAEPITVTVA